MMQDMRDFLNREVARARSLVAAQEWLEGLASLDGAEAEAKARITALLQDEGAARDRLAEINTTYQMRADQIADTVARADAALEAKKAEGATVTADAARQGDAILADARTAAAKVASDAHAKLADDTSAAIANLANVRSEIDAAHQERDSAQTEVAAVQAQLASLRDEQTALRARLLG